MITERIQQPAQKLEHALTPWSTFLIMPIFALANAGVTLNAEVISEMGSPLSLGIIFGLVLGKGVGVSLFSWGAVQLGIAQKPTSVAWSQLFGASWLAGIGFTMSLFIGGNAFAGSPLFATTQLSILVASVLAGFIGISMILITSKVRAHRTQLVRKRAIKSSTAEVAMEA
jgi:NhaA family Na+:H+ antiporter